MDVFVRSAMLQRADEAVAASDGPRRYRFRASTSNVARDGMIIPATEWSTDAFEANPVILLGHAYADMPIGRASAIERDDDGLILDVEFDMGDPRAIDVMRKLDGGFVNAMSVGFKPARIEWPANAAEPGICREVELLEASIVAVPSDPGALAMRAAHSPETQRQIDRLATRVAELEALLRSTGDASEPEATADDADTATDIVIDEGLLTRLRSLS